jgi:hypothetical protein
MRAIVLGRGFFFSPSVIEKKKMQSDSTSDSCGIFFLVRKKKFFFRTHSPEEMATPPRVPLALLRDNSPSRAKATTSSTIILATPRGEEEKQGQMAEADGFEDVDLATPDERVWKILVVGDIGVGKTSFLRRTVHGVFSTNYKSTIGVDFLMKKFVLNEGRMHVSCQMWDVAGQGALRQYDPGLLQGSPRRYRGVRQQQSVL